MRSIAADTVVVPLASEEDARETAIALRESIDEVARIVLVHVIEKAGGAPDKAGLEQRERYAEDVFDAARAELSPLDLQVETTVRFGTDVPATIVEAVDDWDADLLAFSPREANRLIRILTGDTALHLLTESPVPVLVVPEPDE